MKFIPDTTFNNQECDSCNRLWEGTGIICQNEDCQKKLCRRRLHNEDGRKVYQVFYTCSEQIININERFRTLKLCHECAKILRETEDWKPFNVE